MVIQRVKHARVRVNGKVVGRIGQGLLLLVCIEKDDPPEILKKWAHRIPVLRIFNDEEGKMNRSLLDVGGSLLVVSQFTLTADLREKGRRPSFFGAAPPEEAQRKLAYFIEELKNQNIHVEEGIFGAMMEVELVNDGPVTFMVSVP